MSCWQDDHENIIFIGDFNREMIIQVIYCFCWQHRKQQNVNSWCDSSSWGSSSVQQQFSLCLERSGISSVANICACIRSHVIDPGLNLFDRACKTENSCRASRAHSHRSSRKTPTVTAQNCGLLITTLTHKQTFHAQSLFPCSFTECQHGYKPLQLHRLTTSAKTEKRNLIRWDVWRSDWWRGQAWGSDDNKLERRWRESEVRRNKRRAERRLVEVNVSFTLQEKRESKTKHGRGRGHEQVIPWVDILLVRPRYEPAVLSGQSKCLLLCFHLSGLKGFQECQSDAEGRHREE